MPKEKSPMLSVGQQPTNPLLARKSWPVPYPDFLLLLTPIELGSLSLKGNKDWCQASSSRTGDS
ncbi:hypothetical protein SLEP1_g59392 [Rubroshorea leprosula]|uniref:Uncharacterized protein n=1 Tax=Rubroshorea leprosula TaxID=152421 RepID=A0AAV5MWR2_9ROSI|nr:hypothetical protein SLEP1_g59392 [Rubroshorea leprosula]